jgi:hypothetical protein
MYMRKVLIFNTTMGITLPKDISNTLCLSRGDYIELFLRDSKTVVLKKHATKPNRITVSD